MKTLGGKMATSLNPFKLHSYDEFQFWLARNEDLREELEEMMGTELGVDGEALDTLEDFLLHRYKSPKDALRLGERGIIDAASRHVGLVLLLQIEGAKWASNLDDEERTYYSLPVIRFPNGDEECPLAMITTALDRRTGDFLRSLVEGYIEEFNAYAEE
jgi:hypothetical protein